MTERTLDQMIETLQRRLFETSDTGLPDHTAILSQPLTELTDALQELQTASEELRAQNEELIVAREIADTERRRYQELFDQVPDAFLVTDPRGVIREGNKAAAAPPRPNAVVPSVSTDFAVQAGDGGSSGDSALVRGIAASPGRYTGTVRVIMSEHEFGKLQPGDVLVCPITSPVWSVLFSSVGALVTDSGGVLSHSAIIAREYRVPAVVATGNVTAVVRDGQSVTVDGGAGTVELVQEIGPNADRLLGIRTEAGTNTYP